MASWDPELIWLALALVVVILLGVAAIVWARRLRHISPVQGEHTLQEELDSYRRLLEQGQLRPEEFERIRRRLEGN